MAGPEAVIFLGLGLSCGVEELLGFLWGGHNGWVAFQGVGCGCGGGGCGGS